MGEYGLIQDYLNKLNATIDSDNLLLQVQRSPDAKFDDFLFEVGHYLKILQPVKRKNAILANIACGNGLHNLIFSAFYEQIVNVDPVSKMIEHCRRVCRNLPNMQYICDYGQNIHNHYPAESIDDVFFIGVGNLVENPNDYFAILDSIARIIRKSGKLVIGRMPDINKRDAYLRALPMILRGKGFSDERIEEVVEGNARVNCYSPDEVIEYLKARGARNFHYYDVNIQHIGHEMMFDMLIEW